ncbi:tripartite tricarboxylate transporter TctA [Nesterenkonia sp. MY13]|uniref:Tripartite tricarboxylate transporter TctA n=1 Tax=Nesterenkonia sedimenti TaxID=1463632 RepID=A0A7X8TJ34_9MICC|nr:tripartite tricarboxylate transporter permease [Nesterenkonia sedimenti]NLS09687.1 tripartite tricarboxylate transporter TctA [Nesterenkonia sedimenti]
MSATEGFLHGLQLAFTPELLLTALIAAFVGTLIGVLPGLGAVAGAAIALPLTFMFDPVVGLVLIAGIYVGAQYGGSTGSILLNIPGDSTAVVATFDGYPMAQKGRAGPALAITAIGAFIASTIGLVFIVYSSGFVASFAITFNAVDYFALTAGGLLILARISGGTLAQGLLPMILGVVIATVGMESTSSYPRYTFGNLDLTLGIHIAVLAVGIYGVSEILYLIEDKRQRASYKKIRIKDLVPSRSEIRQSWGPWGRGSILGFILGTLPMPSATISTFVSYRMEKGIARNKSQFGKGAVQGLAGPEAANNSAAIGSIVPVLVLGLPFSAVLALMISAMIVHGIQPGPLMMEQQPDLFWSVIGALAIANVMLLVLNIPMIGIWVRILQIPRYILIPVIVLVASMGVFSVSNNMVNLYLMLALGAVGYFLRKYNYSLASMLVGFVLGPLIEDNFVRGMRVSQGDPAYFLSSTFAVVIWSVVVLIVIGAAVRTLLKRRAQRRLLDSTAK